MLLSLLELGFTICVPASGGKADQPCHLPPQIHIESHSNVNICPVFIWRLIYGILSLWVQVR